MNEQTSKERVVPMLAGNFSNQQWRDAEAIVFALRMQYPPDSLSAIYRDIAIRLQVEFQRALPSSPAGDIAAAHCPSCGYTKEDAQFHMDHHLCNLAGKAPWEAVPEPVPPEGAAPEAASLRPRPTKTSPYNVFAPLDHDNHHYAVADTISLSESEAAPLIEQGKVVPLPEPSAPEAAAAKCKHNGGMHIESHAHCDECGASMAQPAAPIAPAAQEELEKRVAKLEYDLRALEQVTRQAILLNTTYGN